MREETHLKAAINIYHRLLFLYPASFRHEFGREMVAIFRDSSRFERDQRGALALGILWIALFLDLMVTASMEHMKGVFARSNQSFSRIVGIGGILAGLVWGILATAVVTTKAYGDIWPYLGILAPALMLVVTIALSTQGNNSVVGILTLFALALGSAALVLADILWLIDFQHPEHTLSEYLMYMGTSIQGLGLATFGYMHRSRGDFNSWSIALMIFGGLLFLPLPTLLFFTTDSMHTTWRTTSLIRGSVVYWAIMAIQAITWMMVGTITFTEPGVSGKRQTESI